MKKVVMFLLFLCLVLPLSACSSSREKELEDQLAALTSRLDAIEGVSPSPSDNVEDMPTFTPSPLPVPTPFPVSQSLEYDPFRKTVAVGATNILIVKKDGSLWELFTRDDGWGPRVYSGGIREFVKIMDSVKSVSTSFCVGYAIDENDDLWCWGYYPEPAFIERAHASGYDMSLFPTNTPKVILHNVRQIEGDDSGYGWLAVKNDDTLWAWGKNKYPNWNQLLLPDSESFQDTPTMVMDHVKAVSLGGDHTLILKTDGSLWGCGHNHFGQLGNGTTADTVTPVWIMDNVKYMSAGTCYSLVVDENDTLWSFGINYSAQLGDGGAGRTLGINKDQEAIKRYSRADPYLVMNDVRVASAMSYDEMARGATSYAVKNDKSLWAWGAKTAGAIGDGIAVDSNTTDIQAEPLQIMSGVEDAFSYFNNGFALKEDGSLWLWGSWVKALFDLEDGENTSIPRKLADDVMLPTY